MFNITYMVIQRRGDLHTYTDSWDDNISLDIPFIPLIGPTA